MNLWDWSKIMCNLEWLKDKSSLTYKRKGIKFQGTFILSCSSGLQMAYNIPYWKQNAFPQQIRCKMEIFL